MAYPGILERRRNEHEERFINAAFVCVAYPHSFRRSASGHLRCWIGPRKLITWREITVNDINPDRRYRIVIPMDMAPKPGIRQAGLNSVSSGPNGIPKDVMIELSRPAD